MPSQNGLFAEPPQRHSRAERVRSTVRPVPLQISRLPCTWSGPLRTGVISSGPPRAASGSDGRVAEAERLGEQDAGVRQGGGEARGGAGVHDARTHVV